jgi:LysM repeat protein
MNAQIFERRQSSLELVDPASAERRSTLALGSRIFVPCRPGSRPSMKAALLVVILVPILAFAGLLIRGRRLAEAQGYSSARPPESAGRFGTANASLETSVAPPLHHFPTTEPPADLPVQPNSLEAALPPTVTYTISKGDTFGKIAKRLHLPVAAVTRANPGVNPARLQLGQKINVPDTRTTAAAPAPPARTGR